MIDGVSGKLQELAAILFSQSSVKVCCSLSLGLVLAHWQWSCLVTVSWLCIPWADASEEDGMGRYF
jgi:hypothetical protein